VRCRHTRSHRIPFARPASRPRTIPSTASIASEDQQAKQGERSVSPGNTMSDQALIVATDKPVTRQAIEAKDRSAPRRVTGKLKTALDTMVWQGARRAEAALTAGMTDHSLRAALKKPHVKAYYLAELDVLRTSERSRNIFRLTEIREQTANQMAAINAIKALEQMGDEAQTAAGSMRSPGVVIVIGGPSLTADQRSIDGKTNVINVPVCGDTVEHGE